MMQMWRLQEMLKSQEICRIWHRWYLKMMILMLLKLIYHQDWHGMGLEMVRVKMLTTIRIHMQMIVHMVSGIVRVVVEMVLMMIQSLLKLLKTKLEMQVVLEVSELVIDLKNTKDRENKTLYKTGGTKNEKR